jgi:hypothetical protein
LLQVELLEVLRGLCGELPEVGDDVLHGALLARHSATASRNRPSRAQCIGLPPNGFKYFAIDRYRDGVVDACFQSIRQHPLPPFMIAFILLHHPSLIIPFLYPSPIALCVSVFCILYLNHARPDFRMLTAFTCIPRAAINLYF